MLVTSTLERITPDREQAHRLFANGDLLPVTATLLADLETPVSTYMKLTADGADGSFLLESVEGGEQVGRYSFIGVKPKGQIIVKDGIVHYTRGDETTSFPLAEGDDPLHVVQREFERVTPIHIEGLPRFIGGVVGTIAYDIVRYFERLPVTAANILDVPDVAFMLVDTLIVFDHAKHQMILIANAHNTGDLDAAYDDAVRRIEALAATIRQPLRIPDVDGTPIPDDFESNMTQAQYEANVLAAKEHIAAGDAFQIVISQRLSKRTAASPLTIYRGLRATNPSPYMFLLRFNADLTLVGASPEILVRYEDGIATNRPIAGSRPRGRTVAEDAALAQELLADPKERAEHVMLVDLGRNDLGRVCEYGSVRVTDQMFIERYSHVMHIVSNVEGKLRTGMTAFDLLRATFPAGTLSGAPKVRAMEIIEALEGERRGMYGGAVGYFSFDGSMDTCITIRTALIKGDRLYIQAGAGIVADSVPETEYQETLNKARALAVTIRRAEQGLL